MMGYKPRIFDPVEAVTLEQRVPADHFYRHLEQNLGLAIVRDLDAMQAFYEQVVGLEVLRRFPNAVFFKIAEGYAGHSQVLALFDRGAPYDDRAGFRPPPMDHIAFSVDRAGLAAEEALLEAQGVEVSTTTHGWVQWRSLYVQDPEGNQVEWVCYDPEVPLT